MRSRGTVAAAIACAACGRGPESLPSFFYDAGMDATGKHLDAARSLVVDSAPSMMTGPSLGCEAGITTLTGKVYDPAGKNPIFDVVVYVPSTTVEPLTMGASCSSCDSLFSGTPVAATTTKTDGSFVLTEIPLMPGQTSVPLVLQVGKWRKQIPSVSVTPCTTAAVPDHTLTLPKNHTDPGNDIPNIAISTGGADTLECLLRRVGVDAAEYEVGSASPGRIHIFTGSSGGSPLVPPGSGGGYYGLAPTTNPPAPLSYQALWDSVADLLPYDIVLLSCEGNPTSYVTPASQQNLVQYTAQGGRVFASHYQYAWLDTGPFGADNVADWDIPPGATGAGQTPDGGLIVTTAPPLAYGTIVSTVPSGAALYSWLGAVSALVLPELELPIAQARYDVITDPAIKVSTSWITTPNINGGGLSTEYLSFNTPLQGDAAGACGRIVFSDIHVSGAVTPPDYTVGSTSTPDGCTDADLTPQEKALEFMLFDLSSCVVPDNESVAPPPPITK